MRVTPGPDIPVSTAVKRRRTEVGAGPFSATEQNGSGHEIHRTGATNRQAESVQPDVLAVAEIPHPRHPQEEKWPHESLPDPSRRYKLPEPLPSHHLLIELCQIYFSKIYGQMYAFLHPPSFMRAVVEAPLSIEPALLLAMAALSARFHVTASPSVLTPDLWASASADIIFGVPKTSNISRGSQELADCWSRVNLSTPSVSCVQALSMISYYYFGKGQSSLAWVVSGFAVRMAHALHLNAEFYDDPIGLPQNNPPGLVVSFKDREVRRRTFWALYIMDRLNSAGEQRPFTIKNHEVNIQLPIQQTLFDREMPALTSSINNLPFSTPAQHNPLANMDCMAWLIRIVDIWGEVTCFVQQPVGSVCWDPESPLMSLRSRASQWLDSLPPSMQYENGILRPQAAAWYIMHTAYHLSLCFMHRFALPKATSTQQYSISHIPVSYINMCVKEAIHHASRVSQIIQTRPIGVKLTAPFMGFAAFSAATMHAFLGFHSPDLDRDARNCYRSYVYTTLEFLRDLGMAWKPLSKMHDALASQISDGVHSVRPGRSSILHERSGIGPDQFRVPDSAPTQFSVDQQIQLNTLAFSNWFNDPTTQVFFEPNWASPARPEYSTNSSPYANSIMFESPLAAPATQAPLQHDPNRVAATTSAPYSEPSLQPDSVRNDEETLAADLLVSFKQSEYLGRGARPPISQAVSHPSKVPGKGSQSILKGTIDNGQQNEAKKFEYLDRLGNLKETGAVASASSVDVLQLMKVGLITAQNWL